ncbi:glycoside hydrolase family 88 protein [Flavobacterium sp.]|uniref:glycoside hydrolase family 88 protein n=1 Tax=Flavobacterium sp. TaxID=239 RepID=UPI0026134C5E|nr:glycoside hydrolase family 88 protein [Flavobacterium sp.]
MVYLLFVLVVLILVVVVVDLYPQLHTWQSRIKIGSLSDDVLWKEKVTAISLKWLKKTPTIKVTDNTRLILIDIVKGNYKRTAIQSWQEASLLLGLNEYRKAKNDAAITSSINNFVASKLTSDGHWIVKPTEVDSVILGYAFLKLDAFDSVKYRPAFDFLYELILNLKGSDGTIAYRKHTSDYRYVDTIGFISPFLVRYGLLFNKPEAVTLGINQIRVFNTHGMLADHFIPCHTYNIKTNLSVGLFGWGRGLGWYAIGLIDAWSELPESHPEKEEVTQMVVAFAKMALSFQNDNGSWNWLVTNRQSQFDSSTTATLAWFFAKAKTISSIANASEQARVKALNYLKQVTRRDGVVDFSQGDTKSIGVHSQHFDILPFTQGFCLRTLSI